MRQLVTLSTRAHAASSGSGCDRSPHRTWHRRATGLRRRYRFRGRSGDGRRLPPRLPLLSGAANRPALDLSIDITLDCVREQGQRRRGDRIGGARPSAHARRDSSRADRSAQPPWAIFHCAACTTRRQPIACAGPHAVGATSHSQHGISRRDGDPDGPPNHPPRAAVAFATRPVGNA